MNSRVWLVKVKGPDFEVDYYAIAKNSKQAEFLANDHYPTATEVTARTTPVHPDEYAKRAD